MEGWRGLGVGGVLHELSTEESFVAGLLCHGIRVRRFLHNSRRKDRTCGGIGGQEGLARGVGDSSATQDLPPPDTKMLRRAPASRARLAAATRRPPVEAPVGGLVCATRGFLGRPSVDLTHSPAHARALLGVGGPLHRRLPAVSPMAPEHRRSVALTIARCVFDRPRHRPLAVAAGCLTRLLVRGRHA